MRRRRPRKPRCPCCERGVVYVEALSLPTPHGPVTLRGLLGVPCPYCQANWHPKGLEPVAMADDGEAVTLPGPWVEPPRGAGRAN